jgi:hypothetical protein
LKKQALAGNEQSVRGWEDIPDDMGLLKTDLLLTLRWYPGPQEEGLVGEKSTVTPVTLFSSALSRNRWLNQPETDVALLILLAVCMGEVPSG